MVLATAKLSLNPFDGGAFATVMQIVGLKIDEAVVDTFVKQNGGSNLLDILQHSYGSLEQVDQFCLFMFAFARYQYAYVSKNTQYASFLLYDDFTFCLILVSHYSRSLFDHNRERPI